MWKAPTVVPTLAYDDVPAAVAWLGRVFGFRERPGARLSWIEDGLIHLAASEAGGARSPRALQGSSSTLKGRDRAASDWNLPPGVSR